MQKLVFREARSLAKPTVSHITFRQLVLLLETYSEFSPRPKQSRKISFFSFQYIRRPVAGYGADYSDGYGYKQW